MCTDRALLPATLDVSQDLQLFLSSKVMRRPNACGGSASTWTDHLRCHGEQIEKALQSRCWRDSRDSPYLPRSMASRRSYSGLLALIPANLFAASANKSRNHGFALERRRAHLNRSPSEWLPGDRGMALLGAGGGSSPLKKPTIGSNFA